MIGGFSSSVTQNTQPLFIIDGNPVGNSLPQAASMISPSNIRSIRILKGNEAFTRYGRDAAGGAVEIRMKREKKE
jgi:outer membrane receptor protein involved in Fe transport